MKLNRFFPHQSALVALIVYLLSALSLQAQTITSQPNLTGPLAQLEAVVYPVTTMPSAIKVIFNNRSGGSVRVIIRNEKGKIFYDEFEKTALYRRRFDLSSLPEGTYTVELSKKEEHFAQTFSIDSPARSNIALLEAPVQRVPNQSDQPKLIVKQ